MAIPDINPLLRVRVKELTFKDDAERELVYNAKKRTLTADEVSRLGDYYTRKIDDLDFQASRLQGDIRHQAWENNEKAKELKKAEAKFAKREKEFAKKDEDLTEREKILNGQSIILESMPENMTDAETVKWLTEQRRFTLALYRSIAEHSTDERIRMQALARLSNEDRGRDGKNMREDDDAPPIILVPAGKYGIPAQ